MSGWLSQFMQRASNTGGYDSSGINPQGMYSGQMPQTQMPGAPAPQRPAGVNQMQPRGGYDDIYTPGVPVALQRYGQYNTGGYDSSGINPQGNSPHMGGLSNLYNMYRGR